MSIKGGSQEEAYASGRQSLMMNIDKEIEHVRCGYQGVMNQTPTLW